MPFLAAVHTPRSSLYTPIKRPMGLQRRPAGAGSRTAPTITRERLHTSRLPAAMRYNGQETDSSQDKVFTFDIMKDSFDEGHDHGISKVPAMERMIFRIKGMCCGEEISVLKRELAPIVGGELNLSFDLLESKMTVFSTENRVSAAKIREVVARTGMEAVPWTAGCEAGVCPVEEGMWERRGRLFLCMLSGGLMLAGFAFQAVHHGSIVDALLQGGNEEGAPPLPALLSYVGAITAGGWFILPKALFALRRLRPDMNLLMVVAVLGAVGIGEWLEAASVTFLFSLALLLESWSVGRARRAIKALVEITPQTARYICPFDGKTEEKPVDSVPLNATVLVRPGEKIPLDGVVLRGETSVNQAPITGESLPVRKRPGDEVFAGTVNGQGAFEFRATKPASDTTLARIIRMVEEGQARRAPTEQWVERFAMVYTPLMMLLALLIAVVPPLLLGDPWIKWFYQALVVLVIACPCSLVISTPVSIIAGLTAAARNGVLIKGGAFLEAPAHIRAIAFDKTGTLTRGRPSVRHISAMDGHSERELLAKAAALEVHSTHPLARAVVRHAESEGIRVDPAEKFTIIPGRGAKGVVGGKTCWIGSHRMIEQWNLESPQFHEAARRLEETGHSLVVMWCDEHVCGIMSIADEVRANAVDTVRELKRLGMDRVAMITGDNHRAAQRVAAVTGVDEFEAEMLPEGKVDFVVRMRESFGNVAMVGDGVNDAPAMTKASVSIAMGAMGSDAAIETADIALMSDDLSKLPWLVRHSRRTLRIIRQNVVFSVGVKAFFVLLSLGGMATLWGAIAADMGASLLVIFNGLRLLRKGVSRPGTVPVR